MSFVNAAIQLAELGYPVFPCVAGQKSPATMHGLLDATTNEDQIAKWWEMWPEANIAVRTDGLLVVDLDPMSDGSQNEWLSDQTRMDSLQRGAVSITPRGGRHCWFRQPTGANWGSRTSALAPRVDTRANGGYVLVSPSRTEAGSYQWLQAWELTVPPDKLPLPPGWIIDLMGALESRRRVPVAESIAEEITAGGRNDALTRLAGYVRRGGASEFEIREFLLAANARRCKPPLDEKEVDKIAWSVARYEPDQITQANLEGWSQATLSKSDMIPDPGPLPEGFWEVPGLMGRIIEWNLETAHRPQPVLALAATIALMGAVTGRTITDRLNTRTNIYTLGVAGSGHGKEHARKVNKLLLQLANMERRIGPEDFGSHAGVICAVSDQPEVLFQLDEMGRFMRTANGAQAPAHLANIITVLLKLFTSSNSLFVGPAYADSAKIKKIEQPHASLYGTTVPESLFGSLTKESIKDGFVGRLLVFEATGDPPAGSEDLDGSKLPPESLLGELAWWRDYRPGGLLSAGIPKPRVIEDAHDARQVFRDFSSDADRLGGKDDVKQALWARAFEKARKLALLYAVSEQREAAQISADAALWACQIVRHLTLRMEYLAERWIADGIFGSASLRVYRLIDDAGPQGITATQLCRSTQSIKPRERDEIILSLEYSGKIFRKKKPQNGSDKQTTTYISVQHFEATHVNS